MYLSQIVQALQGTGPCGGAPEQEVIRAMVKAGSNEARAMLDIYQGIRAGTLRRIYCQCR
jgi:hypothetical protein